MKKEFNLSEKRYENTDCGLGEEVMSYWEKDVKEFIRLLKEKSFIMSILKDCVTIDEEEGMKFICVEDVRKKIDKLAGEALK